MKYSFILKRKKTDQGTQSPMLRVFKDLIVQREQHDLEKNEKYPKDQKELIEQKQKDVKDKEKRKTKKRRYFLHKKSATKIAAEQTDARSETSFADTSVQHDCDQQEAQVQSKLSAEYTVNRSRSGTTPSKTKSDHSCALKNLLSNEYACVGCLLFIFTVTVVTAFLLVSQTKVMNECHDDGYPQRIIYGKRSMNRNNNNIRDSDHFQKKIHDISKYRKRSAWDDSLDRHLSNYLDFDLTDPDLNYEKNMADLESAGNIGKSNYADNLRIRNIEGNSRLREFYTKLIKAEKMINKLKTGSISKSKSKSKKNTRLNRYRRHVKWKTRTNIPNRFDKRRFMRRKRMRHLNNRHNVTKHSCLGNQHNISEIQRRKTQDADEIEADLPNGIIIENKRIFIQCNPSEMGKSLKCSHTQKNSKIPEIQRTHPNYKNSQRLDELLDLVLGKSMTDVVRNPFLSNLIRSKEKIQEKTLEKDGTNTKNYEHNQVERLDSGKLKTDITVSTDKITIQKLNTDVTSSAKNNKQNNLSNIENTSHKKNDKATTNIQEHSRVLRPESATATNSLTTGSIMNSIQKLNAIEKSKLKSKNSNEDNNVVKIQSASSFMKVNRQPEPNENAFDFAKKNRVEILNQVESNENAYESAKKNPVEILSKVFTDTSEIKKDEAVRAESERRIQNDKENKLAAGLESVIEGVMGLESYESTDAVSYEAKKMLTRPDLSGGPSSPLPTIRSIMWDNYPNYAYYMNPEILDDLKIGSNQGNPPLAGRKLLQVDEDEGIGYQKLLDTDALASYGEMERSDDENTNANYDDESVSKHKHTLAQILKTLRDEIKETAMNSPKKQKQKSEYEQNNNDSQVNDRMTTVNPATVNEASEGQEPKGDENDYASPMYGEPVHAKPNHASNMLNSNWKGPMPLYSDELSVLTTKHIFNVHRSYYPINRNNTLQFDKPDLKVNVNKETNNAISSDHKKAKNNKENKVPPLPNHEEIEKYPTMKLNKLANKNQKKAKTHEYDKTQEDQNIRLNTKIYKENREPVSSDLKRERDHDEPRKLEWEYQNIFEDNKKYKKSVLPDNKKVKNFMKNLMKKNEEPNEVKKKEHNDINSNKFKYHTKDKTKKHDKNEKERNLETIKSLLSELEYALLGNGDSVEFVEEYPEPNQAYMAQAYSDYGVLNEKINSEKLKDKLGDIRPQASRKSRKRTWDLFGTSNDEKEGFLWQIKNDLKLPVSPVPTIPVPVYTTEESVRSNPYDFTANPSSELDITDIILSAKEMSKPLEPSKAKYTTTKGYNNSPEPKNNDYEYPLYEKNKKYTKEKRNQDKTNRKVKDNLDKITYGDDKKVPEYSGSNEDVRKIDNEELNARYGCAYPKNRVKRIARKKRNAQKIYSQEESVLNSLKYQVHNHSYTDSFNPNRSKKYENVTDKKEINSTAEQIAIEDEQVLPELNASVSELNNTVGDSMDFLMSLSKWFRAMADLTSGNLSYASTDLNSSVYSENENTELKTNKSKENVESVYDSDTVHRSRNLLSIEEKNDKAPENNDKLTKLVPEGSQPEQILMKEETTTKTATNITENNSTTTPIIVGSQNTTGQAVSKEEVTAKSVNKTLKIVKRSPSGDNLIFWNEIYDEEYGVQDPFDKRETEKESGKRERTKKKNIVRKYANWLGNKVKKIKNSVKTTKKVKKKDDDEQTNDLSNRKHRDLNIYGGYKDPELYYGSTSMITTPDDEPEPLVTEKSIDFKALTENMKEVCKEAVRAVKQTRNLVVSRADTETEAATGLMENLVRLMSDLVDYQVKKKTCVNLPEDLKEFLEWLTLPESIAKETKKKRVDGAQNNPNIDSSHARPQDLNTETSNEKEYSQDTRSECLGTIDTVVDLLHEYAALSDDDKSKMYGVQEYLQNQLNYLNKRLVSLGEIDSTNLRRLQDRDLYYRFKRNTGRSLSNNLSSRKQYNKHGIKERPKLTYRFLRYPGTRRHSTSTPRHLDAASISSDASNAYTAAIVNAKLIEKKFADEHKRKDEAVMGTNDVKRNVKDIHQNRKANQLMTDKNLLNKDLK